MTQAATLRAGSLAASSLVFGVAMFVALTMAVTHTQTTLTRDHPPITVFAPPLPPVVSQPEPARPAAAEPAPGPAVETLELAPTSATPDVLPSLEIASPRPSPVTITAPAWLQRPLDLASYYPRRALARGVEGRVILDCLVDVTGALGCRVMSETPHDWGLGDAALRISRDYRMAPATRAGVPVQGRYTMVVPFEID